MMLTILVSSSLQDESSIIFVLTFLSTSCALFVMLLAVVLQIILTFFNTLCSGQVGVFIYILIYITLGVVHGYAVTFNLLISINFLLTTLIL